MPWAWLLRLVVLQSLFTGGLSWNSSKGSSECPCLNLETAQIAHPDILAQMEAQGFPPGYGLTGCAAHDMGREQTGCNGDGAQASYCSALWCYVDPVLCGTNEDECLAQGLRMDDPSNPACRSREMSSSSFFGSEYFYSYQTCGFLNSYEPTKIFEIVKGRTLIATTTTDIPYVLVSDVVLSTGMAERRYSGVVHDFFQSSLKLFRSPPELRLSADWATEGSIARFGSDYTACVNDVAVGNYDLCLGDFWVTAERMMMTSFLPPFRTDIFYLVIFDSGNYYTFWELLSNPFLPFSNNTWALIFGVVAFMALTMAVLDFGEDASVKEQSYLSRTLQSFFLAWVSIFSGKSHFRSASLSAQISTMGFQIFLLVMVASYKANLASMLIARSITGGVDSISAAVDRGLVICIPAAINSTMHQLHPMAKYFVYSGSTMNFARHMHGGRCDAAVIHDKRIGDLHAGEIRDKDCADVRAGIATEREAHCETGRGGHGRNDCDLIRVGEMVMAIPVAFPIKSDWELVQSLSWAVTQARNSGQWEVAVKANEHLQTEPQCSTGFEHGDRLGEEYFAGASWIVGLAVVIGLGIRGVELWRRRSVRDADLIVQTTDDACELNEAQADAHGEQQHANKGSNSTYRAESSRAYRRNSSPRLRPGTPEGLWQGVDEQRLRRVSGHVHPHHVHVHHVHEQQAKDRDRLLLAKIEELTELTRLIRQGQCYAHASAKDMAAHRIASPIDIDIGQPSSMQDPAVRTGKFIALDAAVGTLLPALPHSMVPKSASSSSTAEARPQS